MIKQIKITLILVFSFTLLLVSYNEALASKEKTMTVVNDESSYKKISLEVTPIELDRYKVKATIQWKKIPKVRGWDIFAIGIGNNDNDYHVIYNTTKATQSYKAECVSQGEVKTKLETLYYTYFDNPGHFNFGRNGVALKQNLKNDWVCKDNFFFDDYYVVTELTQHLEFIVEEDLGIDTETLDVTAFYTHNIIEQSDFKIGKYYFYFSLGKVEMVKRNKGSMSLDDFNVAQNGAALYIAKEKEDNYDTIRSVPVVFPLNK